MKTSAGFTLLETLVVLFILAIIASVALPGLSSSNTVRLELATKEVANALRFARDESIRTGSFHGVHIDRVTTRLFVFKVGTEPNPLVGMSVVYHPVSKQPFDFLLSENSLSEDVVINNSSEPFVYYQFATDQSYVLFDEEGTPFWRDTATGSYILNTGSIELGYDGETKIVTLESGYGRVLIQ